jgi:hypothetical protein
MVKHLLAALLLVAGGACVLDAAANTQYNYPLEGVAMVCASDADCASPWVCGMVTGGVSLCTAPCTNPGSGDCTKAFPNSLSTCMMGASDVAAGACSIPCDPTMGSSCPSPTSCGLGTMNGALYSNCVDGTGTVALGSSCTTGATDACEPTLVCFGATGATTCEQTCDISNPVNCPGLCGLLPYSTAIGYCCRNDSNACDNCEACAEDSATCAPQLAACPLGSACHTCLGSCSDGTTDCCSAAAAALVACIATVCPACFSTGP